MRLGLFMMPLHPPTRTLGAFLAETAQKALRAERLGFDEVWLGEHFSASSEPIPSPLMFMARHRRWPRSYWHSASRWARSAMCW